MDESIGKREGTLTLSFAPLSLLIEAVPDEPDWLWSGYVAPGAVTILAGRPKVGKTTIVCGLLEAVSHGETFLGRETQKTQALLLSEENVSTLAEKVRKWRIGDTVHGLTYHAANGMPWGLVVDEATKYCHQEGLKLLVVDTLAQWARLAGDSENDAGTALDQMRPLQAAAATGLAVLVISHQRKSDGEFGEAIRGSNAIAGSVDVIVEIERPRGFDAENLRVVKAVSRYEVTPAEVLVALGDDGYEVRGDALTARVEMERDRVADAVGALPGSTADAIAGSIDMNKATVARHLNQLEAEQRVKHSVRGVKGDPKVWRLFHSSTPDPLVDESNPTLFGEAAL